MRKAAFFVMSLWMILVGTEAFAVHSVADARAAMVKCKAELQAAEAAGEKNDKEGVTEHQGKAKAAVEKAAKAFEDAGVGQSNDVEALCDYADVRWRLQDYDLAAELLRRAVALKPQDVELRLLLGNALCEMGQGRVQEAVQVLQKGLEEKTEPKVASKIQCGLGRAYQKGGLYQLALDAFVQAVGLDRDNVSAHIGLAVEKVRQGHMREASVELDALGKAPEDVGRIPALLADALDGFTASRRVFPDTAVEHTAYAKLLLRAGRIKDALSAAERAALLDPGVYTIWNFIGDLSRQLGRTVRAREAYEKSLALKPEQPVTQQALQAIQ